MSDASTSDDVIRMWLLAVASELGPDRRAGPLEADHLIEVVGTADMSFVLLVRDQVKALDLTDDWRWVVKGLPDEADGKYAGPSLWVGDRTLVDTEDARACCVEVEPEATLGAVASYLAPWLSPGDEPFAVLPAGGFGGILGADPWVVLGALGVVSTILHQTTDDIAAIGKMLSARSEKASAKRKQEAEKELRRQFAWYAETGEIGDRVRDKVNEQDRWVVPLLHEQLGIENGSVVKVRELLTELGYDRHNKSLNAFARADIGSKKDD